FTVSIRDSSRFLLWFRIVGADSLMAMLPESYLVQTVKEGIQTLSSWTLDELEAYENHFDPARNTRQAHRKRKVNPKSKGEDAAIADSTDPIESAIDNQDLPTFTYMPSKHEAGWLLDSLRPFFDQGFIRDVLALLKGGKEASVYRCEA